MAIDIADLKTKTLTELATIKAAVDAEIKRGLTLEQRLQALAQKYWPIIVGVTVALSRFV